MKIKFIILLTTVFLFISCEEKLKPSIVQLPHQQIPSQESWNATIIFSDSGKVRAVLKANHIMVFQTQDVTILNQGFRVDFYDETGKHTSYLIADSGRVIEKTKNLEAYGNIIAVSDEGTKVETSRLFWDNERNKIRSDAFVKVTSPNEVLQGYGFEADQDLKNYVVYKVSGQARVEEK
ncbi:LPS export ABC transporter protein LptC [Candidatus Kryptobacter tengchongensis]|uniref:LPS export ABC transporter protein LptC n=1 Tax=Kryptobacter tengchongensis TaxID=1643429 RepID=A0A656D6W1_KRYT1|nr:LPS export ABC transporter periplasmic protein LptC [Candidatus Kryptobacter tengchongensis]CUS98863.1 LPS export ABC transporter protein LptC [Candidatus Kryptobacter tengchongensis]CUT00878.1 LPS export ABC transporter protein LptC [Candidatus Kryptobacter tengchongensis]CUU09965.1 LPS export ABC transporter protein LptC [Candidatus Kryptobacter tengchongensis]